MSHWRAMPASLLPDALYGARYLTADPATSNEILRNEQIASLHEALASVRQLAEAGTVIPMRAGWRR
jgi:hypothetical protein